jgi:AcrR family transcriptional regulator
VAEVTLFRHFTNKERLFAEVLRSFSAIPALTELVPQLKSLPYKEALETLTMRYLEQIENNSSWIRVLGYEVNHAPAEMKNVYANFLKQLFGVLSTFFTDSLERGVIISTQLRYYFVTECHQGRHFIK